MNIIDVANALLDTVSYARNESIEGEHCKITVQSEPFSRVERLKTNPLHGVIVHLVPRGRGEEYDLFRQAAAQRLKLTFVGCQCGNDGYTIGLSQKGDGISESFNHSKHCLKGGFKLKLK